MEIILKRLYYTRDSNIQRNTVNLINQIETDAAEKYPELGKYERERKFSDEQQLDRLRNAPDIKNTRRSCGDVFLGKVLSKHNTFTSILHP